MERKGDNRTEYHLYPIDDSKLPQLAIFYTDLLHHDTSNYVWHYEKFHLTTTGETPPHLVGTTCYRDNVEDEWYIVKMLLKLTTTVPDIVVSITDDDGQFLLIEVAHYLPKWIKPDTSINRVFLYQGNLHIIPQPSTPAEIIVLPVTTPTLTQAISLIRDPNIATIATPTIQKCLQTKINNCSFSMHCAHCYMPLPAAHILSVNNQLVSSATHALVERDKDDMKMANKLMHFSPQDHPMVLVDLNFSRLLYAMLINDRLTPPTKQWPSKSSIQQSAVTLGMKLTYGLEILACSYGQSVVGEDSDSQFTQFVSNLKSNGYFGDEIEGSCRYQELIKSAKEYYINEESFINTSVLGSAGRLVKDLLLQKEWSEEYFNQKVLKPSDDDSWLNISPEELDVLLNTRQDSTLGLEEVAYGVKSFVDQVSSVDGAEFPWSTNDTSEIDFNPETFIETCENMLKKLETIKDESDFSDSDYSDGDYSDGDYSDGDCSDGGCANDEEMEEMLKQMDKELSQTTLGQSFHKEEGVAEPVDVDLNLVHNLLDSYAQQVGVATPASNILNTMGLSLSKK